MGPDHDRRKGRGLAQARGAGFRAGEEILEIETTKITNTVEAEWAGTLRRIVAAAGATLPVGALLAVSAPKECLTRRSTGLSPNSRSRNPPPRRTQAEAAAPREIDAAGRRLRYLEMGGGPGIPVMLIHGFGGDLNTWMFTQPALAEARRAIALDLPGMAVRSKTSARATPRRWRMRSMPRRRRSASSVLISSVIRWGGGCRTRRDCANRSGPPA